MKSGHIVKLMPTDINTYKIIRKHFTDNNIRHYTYQLKHERPYRVVIRGIHHPTVDRKEITTELHKHGHEIRNITNVLHRSIKEPLPLFFLDLELKVNNKDIFNLKCLNNQVVKFEVPYKKREITQCKRCQRFGHTKNQYERPYRCVKCGKKHPTGTCEKSAQTSAKCVNCQGEHPASYKGCNKYKECKYWNHCVRNNQERRKNSNHQST